MNRIRGTSNLARACAIVFASVGVATLCGAADWAIGLLIPIGDRVWLGAHIAYLTHSPHRQLTSTFSAIADLFPLAIGIGAYLVVRMRIERALIVADIAVVLIFGGATGNLVEIQLTGAVIDFLGIHPFASIYSAGDICIGTGASLLPLAFATVSGAWSVRIAVALTTCVALVILAVYRAAFIGTAAIAAISLGIAVIIPIVSALRHKWRAGWVDEWS